jgi:hypothetical protein
MLFALRQKARHLLRVWRCRWLLVQQSRSRYPPAASWNLLHPPAGRGRFPATASGAEFVPVGHSPRRSPSAPSLRGGRCRLMLFPPPWFSPLWTPPFPRRPPFKAEIHRGGKTHPGDTARLSSCFSTPPCTSDAFRTPDNNRGPGTRLLLGWPPPRRRLANPPDPPRNGSHTGRTTSSLLCGCRSALGGREALLTGSFFTRSQPFAERRRVKPPVCFLLSFDKLRAGSSQRLHAPAADPLQGNPRARFPWATCFNPSAGSGFKPAANPSPIAVTTAAMGRPAAAPAPQPSVLPDGSTVRPFFCYCKKTPALRFKRKTPGTFRASMPLKRKSL